VAKQPKSEVDRIRYYVRKAAQYSKVSMFERKQGCVRFQRLMAYKEAMHRYIVGGGTI